MTRGVVLKLHDGTGCAPDVAVLESEVEGEEIDTSEVVRAIDLRTVRARLVFALEAVSTSDKQIEDKDVKKNVQRYAAHRVAEYLTYYPVVEQKVKKLVGYRKIPPDAQKRVYSEKLDLEFVIDPSSQHLVAYDATTGRRLQRRRAEA